MTCTSVCVVDRQPTIHALHRYIFAAFITSSPTLFTASSLTGEIKNAKCNSGIYLQHTVNRVYDCCVLYELARPEPWKY
jgi:hypothetical protein